MKPKNFPGRKLRRQLVASNVMKRGDFDAQHPEIADTLCRIGRAKRHELRTTVPK